MKRGITQVQGVDDNIVITARMADGRRPFALTVAAWAYDERMVSRLQRWLDEIDPSLRLVPGEPSE